MLCTVGTFIALRRPVHVRTKLSDPAASKCRCCSRELKLIWRGKTLAYTGCGGVRRREADISCMQLYTCVESHTKFACMCIAHTSASISKGKTCVNPRTEFYKLRGRQLEYLTWLCR